MAAPPVDYYAALEVDSKASQQQIREAYKRQALRHHPDRVPTSSPERAERTRKFQQINDAYYTLSDATRRRDYDAARKTFGGFSGFGAGGGGGTDSSNGAAGESSGGGGSQDVPGGFPWSTFTNFGRSADAEPSADAQFGSMFEEMMREEGMAEGADAAPTGRFWSIVGALSGGAMGFIVANVPGAVAGGVAGNRLGAVRDHRGKSVYSVYQELEQPERMRLLSELATKVFAHAIS